MINNKTIHTLSVYVSNKPGVLARIAQTMPWRSTRPGERVRRKEQGIAVEFVL